MNRLAGLLLFVGLLAPSLSAECINVEAGVRKQVCGGVTDRDGVALPGVELIEGDQAGAEVIRTSTDTNGRFMLTSLKPRSSVRFHLQYFTDETYTFTIKGSYKSTTKCAKPLRVVLDQHPC